MRDPDYTPSWSDTFAFRVKYEESCNLPPNYDIHQQQELNINTASVDKDSQNDSWNGFDVKSLLKNRQPVHCKVMQFSSRNLTSLRSLPSSSLVLLLTPVLAPAHADKSEAAATATDPFESFGRELSSLHRRLRHVPYVPKIGMTDTHVAFIEQAAAVIVVVCETADSDDEALELQQSFANDVLAQQKDDDDAEVPFVFVRFDHSADDFDDDNYKNVLHANVLSKQASVKAAQLLFKADMDGMLAVATDGTHDD